MAIKEDEVTHHSLNKAGVVMMFVTCAALVLATIYGVYEQQQPFDRSHEVQALRDTIAGKR